MRLNRRVPNGTHGGVRGQGLFSPSYSIAPPSLPPGGLCPKRRRRRIKRGQSQAAARLPWPNGPGNRMPQRGQEVSRPQAVTDEGRADTAPPVADEACPPQGSGPIFMARRVWKSVCRNEDRPRNPTGTTLPSVGRDLCVPPSPKRPPPTPVKWQTDSIPP